jgi:nucleoside-diphosphate-sugar epimerase
MRVLVTGDKGFVGRHMKAELLARGYHVVGCDLARAENPWDARRLFDQIDIRFDLVVHCAAVVGGRTMIDGRPLELAVEDLSLDSMMFRWAMRTCPGRIVYFSSSAAYPVWLQDGDPPYALTEDDLDLAEPRLPDQTYGWVKLTGERLAAEANAEGIPTHAFRPFSGYGEDQDLAYPFPTFIARALAGTACFDVWGDGQQVRDFVHIDDVVGAVMAAVDADYREPLNIGTGVATSFDTLAGMCMGLAETRRPIAHLTGMPEGVRYRVADVRRLHEIYTPKITLAEGIERALRRLS